MSVSQSERIDFALNNFARWVGRDIPITEVTTALLENFQRARLKIRAKATVDKELIYVIRALKKCGYLVIKPDPKPGIKTKQRPFTTEELQAFFKACDEYPQGDEGRYKTMFLTMLATGARPAEVLFSKKSTHKPLLKSEVLVKEQRVLIRPSKLLPGKTGKIRSVPVSQMLMNLLVEECKKTPARWPYVFRYRTNLFRLFRLIAKRAGLKLVDELGRKITAHCFRHTYATHANTRANGDVFTLMEALGHSQISTTAIYVEAKIPDLSMDLTEIVGEPDPNDPENIMGEGI
ncbi:site-specific integrase [bacterium]|nr:site-specific integrase [bacterium]